MKRYGRRMISLLLTLVMCVSAISVAALADEEIMEEEDSWALETEMATVTDSEDDSVDPIVDEYSETDEFYADDVEVPDVALADEEIMDEENSWYEETEIAFEADIEEDSATVYEEEFDADEINEASEEYDLSVYCVEDDKADNVQTDEVVEDYDSYGIVTLASSGVDASICTGQSTTISVSSSINQNYTITSSDGAAISSNLVGQTTKITASGISYIKDYKVSMTEIGVHTLTIRGTYGASLEYVLEVTDHSTVETGGIEPTCTEAGLSPLITCSKCGTTISSQTEIPATGHTIVADASVEATCTTTGLTEGSHCSVCGEIFVAQETIAALGHSWDDGEISKEATCTEEGEKLYTCSRCGDTYTASIEMIDHSWDDGEVSEAPTCTEEGNMIYVCTVCGAEKSEVISATGHTPEIDPAVEPTCTDTGLTEGSHCSVCGAIITSQETVSALGHSWDDGEVVKEPTCVEEGEMLYTCSRCGETYMGSIEMIDHSWDDGEVVESPLCTEEGSMLYVCTVCGEEKYVAIDATGHTEEIDPAIEPTCTETGLTEGSHCSVCDAIIVAQEEIPALGHSWDEWEVIVEPTCIEEGEMLYTCSRCGETYTASIAMVDHSWDEGVVIDEATCTGEGVMRYTCSVCGEEKYEAIPATGHTVDVEILNKATCTEDGCGREYCTVCGEILSDWEVIPATGHNAIKIEAKDPTETENGNIEYWYCDDCVRCFSDESLEVEIPYEDTVIPALGVATDVDTSVDDEGIAANEAGETSGTEALEIAANEAEETSEAEELEAEDADEEDADEEDDEEDSALASEDSESGSDASNSGSSSPLTGDDTNITLYVTLMCFAFICLMIAVVYFVRRRARN